MLRERAVLTLSGLILFSLLAAGCDAPRPVQLLVGDQQLAALYWEPPRRLSPAVLLLPAEGGKKEDWLPLATRLRKEGYGVLALDWSRHEPADREAWLADVYAGFAFLRAQKKVDAARIGLVGVALGASVALDFAAREPLARLVVLGSPGLNDFDAVRDSLRDYGARPLLLLAVEEHTAAADAARRLAATAQGEATTRFLPAALAGHPPAANARVEAEILAFLRRHL